MKNTSSLTNQQSYIFVLLIALTGLSLPVSAEIDMTGLYAGVQFSTSKDQFLPDTGPTVNNNKGHLKAKLGTAINDLVSVEGQFGMTTNSGATQGIATYGAYLRVGKDYGQYKPYGLIGFSGIYAYQDNADNVSEASGSYGAGLEIFGSKDLAITFEYIRMIDKSIDGGDLTFDTFGAGFTFYFTEDKSYFNKNRNKIRSIRY